MWHDNAYLSIAHEKGTRADASGRVTRVAYDLLDRLTCVIEHAEPGVTCTTAVQDARPDVNVATRYVYDRVGNRTAIIDAQGHTRRSGYDAAGRLIESRDGLGQVTTFRYDKGGQLVEQTDPRGAAATVTYRYDGLGHTAAILSSLLADAIDMRYAPLGRRTTLSDATGTTSFVFDAVGRITAVTAPGTGTVGYRYNTGGQRTRLTYPDGTTALDYTYHPDGQLATVTQGSTTRASYGYDSAGRLQSTTRANGTVTTVTYDGADRVATLDTTAHSTPVLGFASTVDRTGQRTQVVETVGPATRTITYTYDGVQRLTAAHEFSGNTHAYAYDRAGNRTGAWVNGGQTEAHSYNAANQVIGWSYDGAGNLLSYGAGNGFTYDALNRLTSAAGGAITYAYNGDGVLVATTSGSSTTRYSQDLAAPLSQVLSDGTATYLYGRERLATVQDSVRTWDLPDALGSVRLAVDDTGTPVVATALSYTPFGVPESGAEPTPFGLEVLCRWETRRR